MKPLCFFILLCLFSGISKVTCAQSWFENNPKWSNAYLSGWSLPGIQHTTVEGDTILDGYAAKRLKRTTIKNSGTHLIEYRAARQHGDTIWVWTNERFNIHYNFSLKVGDTLAVPPGWLSVYGLTYVVDSIGAIKLGGQKLRFQRVEQLGYAEENYVCKALIIEKIGMVSGICNVINTHDSFRTSEHFFLDEPCAIAFDGLCRVFCRFQNDQFTYEVSDPKCDNLTGSSTAPAGASFSVWPNPFANAFNVRLPAGHKIQLLKLYAISGKTVLEFIEPSEEINVTALPAGLYFLEILSSEGQRIYARLAH